MTLTQEHSWRNKNAMGKCSLILMTGVLLKSRQLRASINNKCIRYIRRLLYRYGSGTEDQPDHGTSSLPERPEFPPPSLNMVPAFAADLPSKQGSDMLMVCAFLHSFSSLLGLTPMSVDSLLQAGQSG